jgi:O-methyltransferase
MNDSLVIDYIIDHKIKGDLVECGVQDGRIEKIWIEKLKQRNEERHIYMYDTFTGLTEPSEKDVGINNEFQNAEQVLNIWNRYNDEKLGVNTWCYSPLEKVISNLLEMNYPFHKLHFVKGDVRKTLLDEKNIPDEIAVLRLDTDWYDSTKVELETMYKNLVYGGVIIFDDYYYWRGQQDAVDEFFKGTKYEGQVKRYEDSHIGYLFKNP